MAINIKTSNNSFAGLSDTESPMGSGLNNLRVNLVGDKIEYLAEDDDSGGAPLSLTNLSRIEGIGASQGVASDGKYLYTTGYPTGNTNGHAYLMKWTKEGVLVTQNPNARTDGTAGMTQVNGIAIKDGKLYIGANNYADPQIPSAQSFIKVYNSTDLSYIEEFQVKNNITEGCSWYEGFWWVIYNDLMIVEKRDASFAPIAEYPLSYSVPGSFFYQSIVWVDNYILCNIHDGSSQKTIDVYKWTGSAFTEVRRINQLTFGTGQGVYKEPNKNILWFAERHYPITYTNSVIRARLNYLISTIND